jgi:bifunctional enzyme CysN/CysC
VASGIFRPGEEVVVLPSGVTTTIATIVTADGPVEEAFPPMAVTMTLTDPVGVTRGDMICRAQNQPNQSQDIECTVSWMDAQHTLKVGSIYHLKHTTKVVRATVEAVHYRFDINGLHRDEETKELSLNDIGRIRLHTTEPLGHGRLPAQPGHRQLHPHQPAHQRDRGCGHDQVRGPARTQSQRGAPQRQAHP